MKYIGILAGLVWSAALVAQPPTNFAAGQTATIATPTDLRGRPMIDGSAAIAVLPVGNVCVLITDVENRAGRWWYVDAGGDKGWLQESSLVSTTAPEPLPLEPAASPAAPPPPPFPPPPPPPALPSDPPKAPARRIPERAPILESPTIQAGSHELEFAANVNQGTEEIRVFGSVQEVEYREYSASVAYGYFLTKHHQLGLVGAYDRFDFDEPFGGSDRFTVWHAGPRYTLNFPLEESRIVPLASAEYQWLRGDAEARGYELSLGLRALMTASISLNWRLYYQALESDRDFFTIESDEYGLRFGFSWLIAG